MCRPFCRPRGKLYTCCCCFLVSRVYLFISHVYHTYHTCDKVTPPPSRGKNFRTGFLQTQGGGGTHTNENGDFGIISTRWALRSVPIAEKPGSEFFPGGVLFYHPCDRAENVHIPTRETKYAVSTNDEFLDAFTAKNDPSILPVCASQ